MHVPVWVWWTLGICLPLFSYAYFETIRFHVIYDQCAEFHRIHQAFTEEEVCLGGPMSLQYQKLELANCSKAQTTVKMEPPMLCAMRTWWWTSWVESIRSLIMDVYGKSTSMLMISLVLPLVLMAMYYIREEVKAKIQIEALRSEQQSRPYEAFTSIVEQLSNNQQEMLQLQMKQQQTDRKSTPRRIRVPGV